MLRKKIITFFSLVILCSASSVARDITSEEFTQLKNFVNCYYIKAYIERKIKEKDNIITNDFAETYKKKLKPKLDKVTSYQNALSHDEITIEIGYDNDKNSMLSRVNALCDSIDKKGFAKFETNTKIIDYLISLPNENRNFGEYLSKETEQLKSKLLQFDIFKEGTPLEPEGGSSIAKSKFLEGIRLTKDSISLYINEEKQLQVELIPKDAVYKEIKWKITKGENEIIEKSKLELDNSVFTIRALREGSAAVRVTVDNKTAVCKVTTKIRTPIKLGKWFFLLALLIAIIFIVYPSKYRTHAIGICKRTINSFGKSKLMHRKSSYTDLEEWQRNIEKRIADLSEEISKLKKSQPYQLNENDEVAIIGESYAKNKKKGIALDLINSDDYSFSNFNTLYANAINLDDETFFNVSEQPGDMSVFELKLLNNYSATFKIYSEAEKRVIDRPNYLTGCEKEVIGNQALEIIRIGEAHKSGGKWIIDKPLKIRII